MNVIARYFATLCLAFVGGWSLTGYTQSIGDFAMPNRDVVAVSAQNQESVGAGNLPLLASSPNGLIKDLEKKIEENQLVELRTTYNGNYGASLLFHPGEMHYYVTLFQQKLFWRVIRTPSEQHAERAFTEFVSQTKVFAQTEIQRLKLDAEREQTEKQLMMQEQLLKGLQSDLLIQQQQQQAALERARAARQEVEALTKQTLNMQSRLLEIQRSVRALEQQTISPLIPSELAAPVNSSASAASVRGNNVLSNNTNKRKR